FDAKACRFFRTFALIGRGTTRRRKTLNRDPTDCQPSFERTTHDSDSGPGPSLDQQADATQADQARSPNVAHAGDSRTDFGDRVREEPRCESKDGLKLDRAGKTHRSTGWRSHLS